MTTPLSDERIAELEAEAKQATNELEQVIDEVTFEVKITLGRWNPSSGED